MTMQLFWGKRINDNVILVEGDEVLHLTKSLRKKVGDAVDLIDGSGNIFHSVITEIQRGKLVAVNMSVTPKVNHWKKRLHIAIAPTKNADRMEWFVEKAVEVGIDTISFIQCERSVRTNLRMDRVARIVQSAMKQSYNIINPTIQEKSFDQLLTGFKPSAMVGLIAHCEDGIKQSFSDIQFDKPDTWILIGPEGDFSGQEVENALRIGFVPLSLGRSRLRTETAGIYAVSIFRNINI